MKVRVVRIPHINFWVPRPMLLLGSSCSIYLFDSKIEEGEVYQMSYFAVVPEVGYYRATLHPYKLLFHIKTRLQPVKNSPISNFGLSLTSLAEVFSHNHDYEFLVDVIGLMTGISAKREYIRDEKITKMLIVELTDASGKCECALFGDYVDELNKKMGKADEGLSESLKGRGETLDAAGGNSPPIPYASESLAYQHPLDPPERYPVPEAGLHTLSLDESATFFTDHQPTLVEEKKEHLVVARNSLELLSSILNSEAEPKPLKEDITLSLLDKCKQSLSVIKEIVESTTNDEETLFEALYLNDELQQFVSKYEELEASQRPGVQETPIADTAKHDAGAVQNPNERFEGDESEKTEAAQDLDRKLPQKSNTPEVNVNATEVDGHVETKIVDTKPQE